MPEQQTLNPITTVDATTLSAIRTWAGASHIHARVPDEYVPDPMNPYMLRWFVQRKFRLLDAQCATWLNELWQFHDRPLENAYLHVFRRSDEDRALHDHPWSWLTVLLEGSYWEHIPADPRDPAGETVRRHRTAGDVVARGDAAHPHRIELIDGQPVTTLFLTALKFREWGFWCERGWRHWEDFTALDAHGNSSGCG